MGIIILPLFCLFLAQKDTLGAHAFKNRSASTILPKALLQAGKGKRPPKEGTLTTYQILQYFRELMGKTIVTEGKVYRDETVPENHFLIYRFLILCCVADALPMGALVADDAAADLEMDSWVRVEGRLGLKIVDGLYFPTIKAHRITPIEPPELPYLFQPLL
jgi:uncharacterized repeat protein (TIGR03943 family)